MNGFRLVVVTKGVFLVVGSAVNWVLVREGSEVTLIDGGYPGDLDEVEASIRAINRRPEDVRAILVTHAHVDHLGAVNPFRRRYGTPVFLDVGEVPHARRDYVEQLTPPTLLANLWRPGVPSWTARIIRNGALRDVAAPHAQPFPSRGALDLPGAPTPIWTPGHTSGHTAFHLPAAGAVVTGDSLVTGHPLYQHRGPQLLPRMFQHAETDVLLAALEPLSHLDADLVLPGHGDLHRGPIKDAVAITRSSFPDRTSKNGC